MDFKHLILLAALLIVMFFPQNPHAQPKPDFANYEYCVTDDGTFGLYKPKGWKTGTRRDPHGRMVFVYDQKSMSYVSQLFLEKVDSNVDAVAFAGSNLKRVTQQMPDLKILEARSSRDRMRTVVRYQRTGPQKTLIEGKYCFNVKRPSALVTLYEAPAKHFKEEVSTLLTVVANITILDDQVYQKLRSQSKDGGPVTLPMRELSADDRTCSLMVPKGWNLTAGGGRAVCASPDDSSGYMFITVDFVGQSRIPYFDSSKIPGLHYNYMPPIDALIVAGRHFGSSSHRVLERHANRSWAMQASAFLKRPMDAEIALISYTTKNGAPVIGYYDVLGSHPDNAGQWGIIPMGFWAPKSQFAQTLPSLLAIAESYRLNEQ